MSSGLMSFLVWARIKLDFPIPVNSAIRCPAHNRTVSKTVIHEPYQDRTFHAVDLGLNRARQWALMELAIAEPLIVGIGLKMHGPSHGRIIHLDDHPSRNGKRAYWTYP